MMDELYGHRCDRCGGFRNAADQKITFSPEALTKGLEEIFKGMNVRDEIQQDIFHETLRLFNLAAAKGISEAYDEEAITDEFLEQIRHNNEVFSAFRTHRMQNDIAKQLLDEKGQLKPFYKFKKDVEPLTGKYCDQWLNTEYNTAVIRAHRAAEWKHFETEKDVYPNLRWMPTTSVNPDPVHESFWSHKLTLPIDDPFWSHHHPGERWGCKCTCEQTDEPVNDIGGATADYKDTASKGLHGNPAETGQLFSDDHPYYTDSYPGAKKAVASIVDYASEFVPAKSIKEAEEFATKYCEKQMLDRTFKGMVKYSGISLETANEINRGLKKVFGTIKIDKISGIKVVSPDSAIGKKAFKSGADAIASYDPIQKGIYLNGAILKNAETYKDYRLRSQDAWKKVMANIDKLSPQKKEIAILYKKAGRELVDDSVYGHIIHELGHHVQYHFLPTDLHNDLGIGMGKQMTQISGYATSSKSEYIAESFVSWLHNEKRIDYRLQEYLDSKAIISHMQSHDWKKETTSKGSVRINSEHGKKEVYENTAIAKHIAEKYGHDIDLIPNKPFTKSPDAFDKSDKLFNEYKSLMTPTASALDNALRKAAEQADDVVIDIKCDIGNNIIADTLQNRVRRTDIQTVRLIKNGKDILLSRKQILTEDFTIKQDDFQ